MSGELSTQRVTDPDGTRVVILRGQLANTRALFDLVDELPMLQPEGTFLRKMGVTGRHNGRRLSLVLVFEFYEKAEATETASNRRDPPDALALR